MNEHFWWYLARSSGLVAWSMLTATVIWGILLSTKVLPTQRRPLWLQAVHRWLAGLTVSFLAVHLASLLLPRLGVCLVKASREVLMAGIDQDQSRHLIRKATREQPNREAAKRVPGQDVRRPLAGAIEQGVQLLDDALAGARRRAGIAEAVSRSVIGAYPRPLRHHRLDEHPAGARHPQARIKDHRGAALPRAVKVQPMAAHIDELTRSPVAPRGLPAGDRFIGRAAGEQDQEQPHKPQQPIAQQSADAPQHQAGT